MVYDRRSNVVIAFAKDFIQNSPSFRDRKLVQRWGNNKVTRFLIQILHRIRNKVLTEIPMALNGPKLCPQINDDDTSESAWRKGIRNIPNRIAYTNDKIRLYVREQRKQTVYNTITWFFLEYKQFYNVLLAIKSTIQKVFMAFRYLPSAKIQITVYLEYYSIRTNTV